MLVVVIKIRVRLKTKIKLTVFDLLNQNNSISRNVAETYVEDIQTQVLQRYFIVSFTYMIRNFKTTNAKEMEEKRSGQNFGRGRGRN
ncbi:MAG: hypothetical protein COZ18_04885 [Flexibacter sp. CG_4_10_14_3_um_filter_32_15]|nr:MAG: hypothetical protein COZ18_04885 [Flexibacter sp. CG_4_10_14_3_um_filter_32_15]